ARLLALVRAQVELAKPEVAMGDEGAHPQLLREFERPSVGIACLDCLRRLPPGTDLTDEAERICLVARFPPSTGHREGLFGLRRRLIKMSNHRVYIAKGSKRQPRGRQK